MSFDAHQYWEKRLQKNVSLSTTGYLGMGATYNRWLYRGYESALRRILRLHDLKLSEAVSVVDAGAGSGFLEMFATERGVQKLTGLDFTNASVEELSRRFPDYRLIRSDLTQDLPKNIEPADFVFCLSVLYHIVTEEGFRSALSNLARSARDGGYVVIADNFMPCETPHDATSHQRHWSKAEFETEFEKLNLKVLGYYPVFFTLNAPIRFQKNFFGGLYLRTWNALQRFVAGSVRREQLFAPAAFTLDWLFSRFIPVGPGVHYVLLQKIDSPHPRRNQIPERSKNRTIVTLWYRQSFKLLLGTFAYNFFAVFIIEPILRKFFPPLTSWEYVQRVVTGSSRTTYQTLVPYVGPGLWIAGNALFFALLNRNLQRAREEVSDSSAPAKHQSDTSPPN